MSRRQGFTLVELLVAIAIFAVLSALGWKVFDYISKVKERNSMHEVPIQNGPAWRQAIAVAQILFVAFGATVLVPLLTGLNPSLALLGAGVGTLLFEGAGGELGDVVAEFEPSDTNSYYYFQKITPIYTDKECTQRATVKPQGNDVYYYKDEFEEQGENGEAKPASAVIEFIGGDAAKFDGAIVADEDGNLSFSVGTARLAFIDELHTTKGSVGGNKIGNKIGGLL